MSWTPKTLARIRAPSARDARGDAEALVTTTARLTLSRAARRPCAAPPRRCTRSGIRRGDFVGILLGNDETWVDAVLCAQRCIGAVTVPVNTRFKSAELAFCLKQADVKALFTRRPLSQHRFPGVPARGGARGRPRAARQGAAAAASTSSSSAAMSRKRAAASTTFSRSADGVSDADARCARRRGHSRTTCC